MENKELLHEIIKKLDEFEYDMIVKLNGYQKL